MLSVYLYCAIIMLNCQDIWGNIIKAYSRIIFNTIEKYFNTCAKRTFGIKRKEMYHFYLLKEEFQALRASTPPPIRPNDFPPNNSLRQSIPPSLMLSPLTPLFKLHYLCNWVIRNPLLNYYLSNVL